MYQIIVNRLRRMIQKKWKTNWKVKQVISHHRWLNLRNNSQWFQTAVYFNRWMETMRLKIRLPWQLKRNDYSLKILRIYWPWKLQWRSRTRTVKWLGEDEWNPFSLMVIKLTFIFLMCDFLFWIPLIWLFFCLV